MIGYLKEKKRMAYDNFINMNGWRTDRKLIVIESDDWGSIRMPSAEIYHDLLKSGDRADEDPFTRYDALESESDIRELAGVLVKFKDRIGNNPVITANFAVANPDFDKIKEAGFQTYFYEPITKTYERYPEHQSSFRLIQEYAKKNILCPQLHCREHLNVNRWMRDLNAGKIDVRRAFDNRMISSGESFTDANRFAYMDSFNYDMTDEIPGLKGILAEGGKLFKDLFGYDSRSFIASCYVWGRELEDAAADLGIDYLQGDKYQLVPQQREGSVGLKRKGHFIGQKNHNQQLYLMRNCTFEPSWDPDRDWIDSCLSQINTAFRWQKPATISTHRLNYIGFIDLKNRERNLVLLETLIAKIVRIWPDVEFITTIALGDLIRSYRNGKEEI